MDLDVETAQESNAVTSLSGAAFFKISPTSTLDGHQLSGNIKDVFFADRQADDAELQDLERPVEIPQEWAEILAEKAKNA